MPRMGEDTPTSTLMKLLLIGDSKIGKTYYAALAAKAGFNILYLDGDVGATTISSMIHTGVLTKEEASRIYLIDCRDTIEGGKRDTRFVEFMNEFTSSVRFRWNETANRIARRNDTGEIWEITPAKMDENTILIIDSWTAYVESVMLWCARANSVDLANATTAEMRPVYQGGGLKSTEMLQIIRSLNCHLIAIGHPDEYQHTTNPDGRKVGSINEKDKTIEWTKGIAKSTSKPQGLQMGKYFTDVGWMELSPAGNERRISFKPSNDRVVGGHFSEVKSIDEYSFANMIKQIGGRLPTGEDASAWLKIEQVEQPTQIEQPVLDGTKATTVKGIAGLMQKK